MDYQNILIENDNGIVILTFNREKALNALNQVTMTEIKYFFDKGYKDFADLKGVILTGTGVKAFVAGADITEFTNLAINGEQMAQRGQDIFFLIEQFHKPVIAAVNGFALGGGCELAMACHMRIASPNAKFAQPEVNLGIIPGYGGTQRLVQLIGKGRAYELLMTGDMIDAAEAHRTGLVNHVVEEGQTVAKAKEIIAKIATKAPLAIAKIVEAVNAHFDPGGDAGFFREVVEFGKCAKSKDFKEGAAAFVEKRKPVFTGK
ncbi:MAG: enoyl-CoA hydratase-related protein [Saprospiraceae bacterium]|nr:enoyl-CoA hydratase-related protein [Saprospiraceae bacterium]